VCATRGGAKAPPRICEGEDLFQMTLKPVLLSMVCLTLGAGFVSGQTLPFEPALDAGQSITGAYEGWFANPDGSFSILLGYFNRNMKQPIDIPIGANNRIEPDGPDRGQPTHFQSGRGWGVFAIKVPKDFGQTKLTWTIVANGKQTVIKPWLNPDYEISPFIEAAVGNTPPVLRFQSFKEQGPTVQGPQGLTVERTAKVGGDMPLPVWMSDDAKWTSNSGAKPRGQSPIPVTVTWTQYRGPAPVTFSKDRPEVEKSDDGDAKLAFSGKSTTTAKFSEPGDYVLKVTINDYSGEGGGAGFQCCWTNGFVKVNVTR
jgi:hypothetical protein